MADRISAEARSRNMAQIHSRDTRPERRVRSLLHAAGFRFRLCDKSLPGTPDIVLRRWRTAIFVHGCFWHRHAGCAKAKIPEAHRDFWEKKLRGNAERDARAQAQLRALGWRVIVIWQCEIPALLAEPLPLFRRIRGNENPRE